MMKGLYRLINIEFAKWLRLIMILCAATMITPLIMVQDQLKNYSEYTVNERYEDLYASSGSVILFLIFLVIVCAFFLKTVYADYWGGKSIYTYLTLPVKREAFYFSKLIVFAICLLMLLAAQLISIRIGYALAAAKYGSYGEGQFVMHNGFFLAMIRSEFFRLLLPLSLSRLLSSLAVFTTIATGFYYGALCERSRKYFGFAAIVAALWIMIAVIGYRMNEQIHYSDLSSLWMSSSALFALSGFFIWHSLHILRRGAVA
ncbi:ABC transporter permease [Paenibacillus eucommiae]|uniref:ABC transporter permease n=1 Tax=Paenibacillus eucommiae TaxID=1355755 RepID=A0ABS4J7E9_9BACL|nr:ABC transporter permease [Paenibacillus eucommiae]MBP1995748.1 hypothetical protein [Paenibacillus eucommiae]